MQTCLDLGIECASALRQSPDHFKTTSLLQNLPLFMIISSKSRPQPEW
jgi:hypothetical protein